MELSGKHIIVSGGAGGVGAATVRLLLSAGAKVGAFDRDGAKLEQLRSSLDNEADRLLIRTVDIGRFTEVEKAVEDFFQEHGSIDVLVNNAAVLRDGSLVSIFGGELKRYPLEAWDETIASNLSGSFYLTREVAARMVLRRTRGVIINVSSISAAGNIGQTAYAASKAAINALTVTWAQELCAFGIRVAGLAPGMTDTSMPRSSMSEKLLSQWVGKTPLRRMAKVEEMAHALQFILQNDFFCGRTLELDGGLRM